MPKTGLHWKASGVNRSFLETLSLPEATRTHKPVPHAQLVEALVETLGFRHLEVVGEQYAVSPDGMRMLGVLTLKYEYRACRFAIGIRNSNDKRMRFGLNVGYRVLVCDNLAFLGDRETAVVKHSAKMNLIDVVSIGVDKIQRTFESLKTRIDLWKSCQLDDQNAKACIYDAFLGSRLNLPRTILRVVNRFYFEPQHDEFKPRTMWSLSNAFTSAFKKLQPTKQFQAMVKLGDFLEAYRMGNTGRS